MCVCVHVFHREKGNLCVAYMCAVHANECMWVCAYKLMHAREGC